MGLELGTTDAMATNRLIVDARQEPPIGLFSPDGRPQLKLVRVESMNVCRRSVAVRVVPPDGDMSMKKTETNGTVLLKRHQKQLKLPNPQGECENVAQRCATENVDT